MNFSDLRDVAKLPCATISVEDCEVNQSSWHETLWTMNVHLEAQLLMHTLQQPLLAVCSAVCGIALSPPGKNTFLLHDRRMVYALDHNPYNNKVIWKGAICFIVL